MGEAQVIHDSEFDTSSSSPKTGLYNSGSGYYNPETGTALGGTGAPASTNPTSASAEEPTAQSTRPASQLGGHAAISTIAGGVPSSTTPAASADVAPESSSSSQTPAQRIKTPETSFSISVHKAHDRFNIGGSGGPLHVMRGSGVEEETPEEWWEAEREEQAAEQRRKDEEKRRHIPPGAIGGGGGSVYDKDSNMIMMDRDKAERMRFIPIWNPIYEKYKEQVGRKVMQTGESMQVLQVEVVCLLLEQSVCISTMVFELEWVVWGVFHNDNPMYVDRDGKTFLFGYKLKGENPHFFFGPKANTDEQHKEDQVSVGNEVNFKKKVKSCGDSSCTYGEPLANSFFNSWAGSDLNSLNYTGKAMSFIIKMNSIESPLKIGFIGFTIPAQGGTLRNFGWGWITNIAQLPSYMWEGDAYGTCYVFDPEHPELAGNLVYNLP
jgi:hypothetical protein